MIENWKNAWKFYSVQLALALAVVAELDFLKPHLPEHWVPIFSALIVVSRVVSQSKDPSKPEVILAAMNAIKKSSGALALLMLTSCGAAETSRQTCLASAEIEAQWRADSECHELGWRWESCPARPEIMKELAEKQEDCR